MLVNFLCGGRFYFAECLGKEGSFAKLLKVISVFNYLCSLCLGSGNWGGGEGKSQIDLLLDPSGRGSPGRAQSTRPGFQHGNDGDDGAFPAGFVGRP